MPSIRSLFTALVATAPMCSVSFRAEVLLEILYTGASGSAVGIAFTEALSWPKFRLFSLANCA